MTLRVAGLFALTLLWAAGGHAHTLSESYSSWSVNGSTIRLQFTVPALEAQRLSKAGEPPAQELVGDYLAQRVGVTAAREPCRLEQGPLSVAALSGFSRYEMTFACRGQQDIRVHSRAFQDLVPSHTNFARVQSQDGTFFEQVLTRDQPEIEVSGAEAGGELRAAGLLTYVRMGILHIFTGIDHMSFMLGLVLISRRVRDLIFVVTGFTLGHSLTLGLAVTGILRPDARYIDSLVALTIALIGAENIGDSTRRPLLVAVSLGGLLLLMAALRALGVNVGLPTLLLAGGGLFAANYLMLTGHMSDAGRVRIVVTAVFGLIHGFGFASNLLEMHLPPEHLAKLLVGFNLGVEVGQLTVVLSALLVAGILSRLRLGIPRPLLTDVAAAFLVGEGLYWFIGRSVTLS